MQQKFINGPLTSGRRKGSAHRPPGERRARLETRKRQIEARISDLDARQRVEHRKKETRANIVLGAIMRAHASLHPAFGVELAHILDIGLRRPTDRQLLADVLGLPRLIPAETRLPHSLRRQAGEIVGRHSKP